MSENEISRSKQKRLDIENARKEQQRKKTVTTILYIAVPVILIAAIGLAYLIFQSRQINYGKYLTEEGTISNINPGDYIQFDYKNLSYNRADLLPADETVDADIESLCESLATLSDAGNLIATSENKVNLSYTSEIGGVSYNYAEEEDYTIGSGYISDDFDEKLIGHKPGDHFQCAIDYPVDYYDSALAGLTVSYDVTLNGVYVTPEFTDELVAANFGSIATTAEGYRDYLINEYVQQNLRTAVTDSLTNGGTVLKYPEEYLANVERIYITQNQQQFESYNSMYYEYLGYNLYNSVYEMYGYATEEEYLAEVHSMAMNDVSFCLAVMTVFKNEGMTNTRDEVMNYYNEQGYDAASFQELETQYHFNYLAQMALANKVTDYLVDTVTVVE